MSAMSGFTSVVTKYQSMSGILQRPNVIVATAQSQTDIFYAELSACIITKPLFHFNCIVYRPELGS